MWCDNCGQDVPQVASPQSGRRICLRCGKPFGTATEESARSENERLQGDSETAGLASSVYDGWEADERLRHVGRMLGKNVSSHAGQPSSQPDTPGRKSYRIDASHTRPPGPHERSPGRGEWGMNFSSAISWGSLLIGLTALACGGVLLGWSWWAGRAELWDVGLPTALIGLAGLIFALILQIDRLGRENRQTAAQLNQVGSQLRSLRTTTEMMGTAHRHSPSSAFYSHLADGAGPQMLLSDLKSQLDLLAARMAGDAPLDDD
ncbi:MAG: hypothetical protein JW818_23390 [Pirellulales bacterium]|nr:hypothetical protein [Pirellulales bacterium]